MIDGEFLEKGKEYNEMPEVHIYYLSEKDIYKTGRVVSPAETHLSFSKKEYRNGVNVVYVNAEINDGSEVAKMMEYFMTADPEDDSQGELSERVRFLKKEEGAHEVMCKVTDEIYQYGEKCGREIGIEIGEKRGRKLGEKHGREVGEAHINTLNRKLQSDGRIDDLLRSISDAAYQKQLLAEYDLEPDFMGQW